MSLATGRGGPGVPGRLRPRIILTFRHYKGGRSSAKRTGRLYPRRNPWHSLSEAESTSGHMVLSGIPRKKSLMTPPGIDPGTVRLVAQCLNHYATPGTLLLTHTDIHFSQILCVYCVLLFFLYYYGNDSFLNFLAPSGPLQACNGTALPLSLPISYLVKDLRKIKERKWNGTV